MAAELLDEGTLHLPAWRQSLMRQTITTQRQTYRGKSTANSLKGLEEKEMKSYFKRKKKILKLKFCCFSRTKTLNVLKFDGVR